MASRPKHIGTVKIGVESYLLAETDDRQAWQKQFLHEPPWSDGLPAMLSEPSYTWHLGGLKTKQGFPGTSEYGQNTDARFPFRLLPGPKLSSFITLPSATASPVRIFEALGYIWAIAGRYVYRINPADDTVVLSKDLGVGVNGIDGLKWESNKGLVTTDAADQSLWEVSAIGSPDTWTQSAVGVKPYRLAAGIDRLFGVQASGLLRDVVSGLNPLVAASWSDKVQCGDTDSKPNGILAFEKTVLVGKPEGLFGVSPEGKGVPLIKRMIRDPGNCLGMRMHEPYAVIPHARGTYWFLPGLVESMGIEREVANESVIKGRFKDFATDGQWLIGLLPYGVDNTYIMAARDRAEGEAGFGPLIWDTLTYLPYDSETMHLSSVTSPPRLWFNISVLVAYIKLSASGGAPDVSETQYRFATSGFRITNKYDFGDRGPKDFPKALLVGKNLTTARYWVLSYSIDGGAFLDLDIGGTLMKINANGPKTFFLPLTAFGREIQYKFAYTGDVDTIGGELTYFEPFAVPQSRKLPTHLIQLHLARDASLDLGKEYRSSAEQLSDLAALSEGASAVKASGPWGEDKDMVVRSLQLVQVMQESDAEPEYLVEVSLQEREVA